MEPRQPLPTPEEMREWLWRFLSERPADFLAITAKAFTATILYAGLEERIAHAFRAVQVGSTAEAESHLEELHRWLRDRMAYGGHPHASSAAAAAGGLTIHYADVYGPLQRLQ